MKSTEVSPRLGKSKGRPPIRKRRIIQKNASALENENSKSIRYFLSPPPTAKVAQEDRRRGESTPRKKKNPLANLESNLSPKYIGFSTPTSTEQRKTRYRIAKLKDSDGSSSYFRNSRTLIGCVRRTTVIGCLSSPLSSPEMSRSPHFESPIEKLLRKNGASKPMISPPLDTIDIFDDSDEDDSKSEETQSKKKNCVVRIEQLKNNEFAPIGNNDVDAEMSENIKSASHEADSSILEKVENSADGTDKEMLSANELVNQPTSNNNMGHTTNSNRNTALSENSENGNNIVCSIHGEHLLHLQENKYPSEDIPSIKSPSTFSVDSAKGSSLDNDLNWVSIETGDLFWGQIFQFAYWPCMVCPDLEGKTISYNESRGQMQHIMIHVRFFADNGRRSWVKRDNLMPYTGLEQYEKKMKDAEQKYGKRSPKYKVFVVSKAKSRLWHQAIREADVMDAISSEDRLQKFFELLEEVKLHNILERKRRQSLYLHSSTSDISSMFDSNDNLYLKQNANKRDRSPTPISPAYSPLGPKNIKKRMKLDVKDTSNLSNISSLTDETDGNTDAQQILISTGTEVERIQTGDIYSDIEFKKFTSAMRAFILESSTESKLETQFMLNVRSMWALKHITFRNRIDSSLEVQNTSNAVKRLSQRIRNISVRKSLPSTPVQYRIETTTGKSIVSKAKRAVVRPIEEVIEDIFQLDTKYLFRGVSKDPVCKECLQPGQDLVKCSKNCQGWMHSACSANFQSEASIHANEIVEAPFLHITGDLDEASLAKTTKLLPIVCNECNSAEPSKCFVCKSHDPANGELARCNSQHCGKIYHPNCLRYWPQAKLTNSAGKLESLRCPAHVCHTCVSDDPKGKFLQIDKSKLTKCIKCPATYHMDSTCIPAGSQFLSTAFIICPRHSKQQEPFINVNWCFICVSGGKLVCCETCPTAVHAECLKIPLADEGYICEECETGRMPLYGEMVWAKFNNFRWWPSLILPPPEVPANLARKAHNSSEFVIRFFGTNDHAWISRRRVYLYQEGDCSEPPRNQKKGLDHNYIKGVEEAKRIADIIKEKKILIRANDKKQRISPLPYVKIKSNRAVPPLKLQVDLEKISKCECDKESENPCGQDSGCLNRVLFTECNPKICPAGDRCQNQLFEKKVYPKLEVSYMNEKGFGLICLEPISAGTFVIEYVGEVIDDAEFRRRIAQKEKERDENFYFLTLEKDYIIDAGPKGNLARFMNHSCDPNCETQKWSINGLNRIGLFAIKNIPKNTELTFNYFWDELLGNEKKSCHCGAEKCAGLIGGKYKQRNMYENSSTSSSIKISGKSKQKTRKIKVKSRQMSSSKLKSPKRMRKLKTKETSFKSGKRSKIGPKTIGNDRDSTPTGIFIEEKKQKILPESKSMVDLNASTSPAQEASRSSADHKHTKLFHT